MLRSLLALLLLGACAHGPTTSTAVRYAATDEVTTMALRESITRKKPLSVVMQARFVQSIVKVVEAVFIIAE